MLLQKSVSLINELKSIQYNSGFDERSNNYVNYSYTIPACKANDDIIEDDSEIKFKRFSNFEECLHETSNKTLTNDALSHVFTFLDKKEIAMFANVSKGSKYTMNQYYLRYCHWMVNKRNDGVYVLKYIDNFDGMNNINIDTLSWSDKYNGNENWDIIHNIINNNDNNIKSHDIWYLLNDYWFGNNNFGWGTFKKSSSRHKANGEWKILNNTDIYDTAFYLNVDELNGILGMLRHPFLMNDFADKIGPITNNGKNNCSTKPICITFDKRNHLLNMDTHIQKHRFLHDYKITYW